MRTDQPDKTSSATKSQSILSQLRHRLRTGHYPPGARFYSNNSLAMQYGVSAPTAGKIIDALCAEGFVRRIHGSGTYVNDINIGPVAKTYALLIWVDLSNPKTFATLRYEAIREFEQSCNHSGARFCMLPLNDPQFPKHFDRHLAQGMSGVFYYPSSHDQLQAIVKILDKLRQRNIALVSRNLELQHPDTHPFFSTIDRVDYDEIHCGGLAADHFLALRHRKLATLAYAKDRQERPWQSLRIEGFLRRLAKDGITVDIHHQYNLPQSRLTTANLKPILHQIRKEKITGVFAMSDELALNLIEAACANKIRIPEDLAVIGVGNSNAALIKRISSIDHGGRTLAHSALRQLRHREQNPNLPPETKLIHCSFIARESTAVIPTKT